MCFRFSVFFRGGEGRTSGSDAELSAARPESGLEWAEARLDRGAAALRPMLGVLRGIREGPVGSWGSSPSEARSGVSPEDSSRIGEGNEGWGGLQARRLIPFGPLGSRFCFLFQACIVRLRFPRGRHFVLTRRLCFFNSVLNW